MDRKFGATIALLATFAACVDSEPSADAAAAEAVAAAAPPMAPFVTASSILTVESAAEPFGYVGDAVTGPDGGLLVADVQERTIHRFDALGTHAATIGQQGRGAGELEGIAAIAVSGDTVFVWDPIIWRVSAFDPDGTLIMARRVEPRRNPGWPVTVARAADGTWLYLDQEFVDTGEDSDDEIVRATASFVRWSVDTDQWTPVARVPGLETGVVRSEAGEPTLVAAPFGRGPVWAPDRNGGYWYADNGAYVVTRFTATGDTIGRIVVGMQGPPVTAADRASYLSGDDRLDEADPQSQFRERMPMPERKPVLLDLLTSREGDLWVGVDAGVADSVEWHAFDEDRRMRHRLRLPAGSELRHVSGDTVVVVTHDAAGVQRVSRMVIG